MAFLKERIEQQELGFHLVYWRRMLLLVVVGYLHGLFIWDGDILLLYAVTSFFTIFLFKAKGKRIAHLGIYPVALYGNVYRHSRGRRNGNVNK